MLQVYSFVFQELTHVLARTLVADQGINKPVLFGLALKDYSPKALKIIKDNLPKFKVW